jgi:hypothetical protein
MALKSGKQGRRLQVFGWQEREIGVIIGVGVKQIMSLLFQ